MAGALDGLSILLEQVQSEVETKIEAKTEEVVADVKKQLDELKKYTPTVVIKDGKQMGEMKGLQHRQLTDLVRLLGANQNVLLVGMAGTGKTHSAKQVADAVQLDFYAMSVGAQTSKSDIVGYMDANGNYVTTAFRKAYENGGVFVLDEIDAGNSNVLIILNSALSNGIMNFPDKMVDRHENFRFVATANTYGNGADRQYVGRNQLDGATLDRFTVVDWLVDEDLEEKMVSGYSAGKAWFETIKSLRKHVADSGIRALITPRATQKGAVVYELGLSAEQMIEMTVLPQIPQDKREDVKRRTMEVWQEKIQQYPPTKAELPKDTTTAEAPTHSTQADEEMPVPMTVETFDFRGDKYEMRTDTAGRQRCYKNGGLITRSEFDEKLATMKVSDDDFDIPVPF